MGHTYGNKSRMSFLNDSNPLGVRLSSFLPKLFKTLRQEIEIQKHLLQLHRFPNFVLRLKKKISSKCLYIIKEFEKSEFHCMDSALQDCKHVIIQS